MAQPQLGTAPSRPADAMTVGIFTGAVMPFAGNAAVVPAGWLLCYGQAVSRTTYASLFAVLVQTLGNPTITSANPGVVTLTAHGLVTGDPVIFTTTGALPTNITAGTTYYVTNPAANTFNLSTTFANAVAGTKINTTAGTQSGVHTLIYVPYGNGDGSTTFNVPDLRGRAVGGMDSMGGTAAGRLTGVTGSARGTTLGAAGGEEAHLLSQAEMPSHTHTLNNYNVVTYTGAAGTNIPGGTGYVGQNLVTDAIGGGGAHNNVQPSIVLNYLIKT